MYNITPCRKVHGEHLLISYSHTIISHFCSDYIHCFLIEIFSILKEIRNTFKTAITVKILNILKCNLLRVFHIKTPLEFVA